MADVVLVLYLFYLGTAFGMRGLLHRRRTGSTGFHGLGGRPWSWEWLGGVLFALAVLLGLLGPLLQLAGAIAPVAALDATVVHAAGLALAVTGISATLVAQHGMGASWRVGVDPQERTALVTGGVFAFVRNPIFTAMVTAALGLTLLAPNLVAMVGLAALVVAIEIQVRVIEEPYLLRWHREDYQRYTARVGRFLPGLGRFVPSARSGASGSDLIAARGAEAR